MILLLHMLHDKNINSPSSIRRTGLNSDESHPSVSSKTLIKDEEANQMVTPKCSLFLPRIFDGKSILGYF